MARRVMYFIDDLIWLKSICPGYEKDIDELDSDHFRCVYVLKEDPHGVCYELKTESGITNVNDLSSYERSCLWPCYDHFCGHLSADRTWGDGLPDHCIRIEEGEVLL